MPFSPGRRWFWADSGPDPGRGRAFSAAGVLVEVETPLVQPEAAGPGVGLDIADFWGAQHLFVFTLGFLIHDFWAAPGAPLEMHDFFV